MQSLVTQALLKMGGILPNMDRSDKMELIRRLDEQGVFQVNKAVSLMAELPDLRPAVAADDLQWQQTVAVRGVQRLPVEF